MKKLFIISLLACGGSSMSALGEEVICQANPIESFVFRDPARYSFKAMQVEFMYNDELKSFTSFHIACFYGRWGDESTHDIAQGYSSINAEQLKKVYKFVSTAASHGAFSTRAPRLHEKRNNKFFMCGPPEQSLEQCIVNI